MLADPFLTLKDAAGNTIRTNDDWASGDDAASMRRLRITISDRAAVDPFADPRRLRVHPLPLAPLSKGGAP